MKTRIYFSQRSLIVAIALIIMTVIPSSAQPNFSDEILVYFVSGVRRDIVQRQLTRFTSPVVRAAFAGFNIDSTAVLPAFPNFNEADTLVSAPDGRTIKLSNLGKIFRVKVPNGAGNHSNAFKTAHGSLRRD